MRLVLFPLAILAAASHAAQLQTSAFRLPRAPAAQVAFLKNAALQGAPELAGLDANAPDFALAVTPLAERLATGTDLPAAKREAGLAAARRILDAAQAIQSGAADTQELRDFAAAAARWGWYGEPAEIALTRLRGELGARRIEPLLRDPFRQAQEEAVPAPAAATSEPARLAPPRPHDAAQEPPPAPKPPKKSDLAIRAATATLLVPGIIAFIHFGGLAFTGLALAISLASLSEFAGLMKNGGRPVSRPALLLGGGALAVSLIAGWPIMPVLGLITGAAAAAELWAGTPSIERAAATVFGALLFGLLPAHLALLRALAPHGGAITLAVFGAAWASDTAAYFFGKRFGRRKIAPRVSPNKTWEGAFAGLAAAMAIPLALSLLSHGWLPLAAALKVGVVMGTIGQLGGYVNSLIKRANGAKDSGKLFPGHGGAIDRFDSYLLSAALLYYLLRP